MKNYAGHMEKCIGGRPEVHYKGGFMINPNPNASIIISELIHDTGLSGNAIIGMMIEYALAHMKVSTKQIKVISFIEDETNDE